MLFCVVFVFGFENGFVEFDWEWFDGGIILMVYLIVFKFMDDDYDVE